MGMSHNKSKFSSEINVTPFVDVMLVLLIIFMVTAPMMDQGIEIELPQTKQVDVLPTDSEHLVLSVSRNGALYLQDYEVKLEELEERIKLLVTDQSRALFLQADTYVPYGVVVDIMARVKAAGIVELGIVAAQSDVNANTLMEQHLQERALQNTQTQHENPSLSSME